MGDYTRPVSSTRFATLSAGVQPLPSAEVDNELNGLTTAVNARLEKLGGTMTGFITLHNAPTNDFHAATKKYVDDAIAAGDGDKADKTAIQSGALLYAVATGSVNVMVAAFTPTLGALTAGMELYVKVNIATTTTTPTVNPDTLGAKTIKRVGGVAVLVGDLPADHIAVLKYDGTDMILQNPVLALPHGTIQEVSVSDGVYNGGNTTVMVLDDTIPEKTEGDEYMTLAITPTSATNKLEIEAWGLFGNTASGGNVFIAALFQDAITNALAATYDYQNGPNRSKHLHIRHEMVAGGVAEITFKLRVGLDAAGTTYFNGYNGGGYFGGVAASGMRIREIHVP